MDQLITQMSTEEFDAVIEQYIERESQDMDEIPAPVFYQALRDIYSVPEVEETGVTSNRNHARDGVTTPKR